MLMYLSFVRYVPYFGDDDVTGVDVSGKVTFISYH